MGGFMGIGGGGSKTPKPAPAPEAPTLPPPKPTAITENSVDIQETKKEAKRAELRGYGRNKTILAGGGLGVNSTKPSILGAG